MKAVEYRLPRDFDKSFIVFTYYFMPINAFVSGSAGIGSFTIDNQD